MRPSRALALVIAALAVSGCAARTAPVYMAPGAVAVQSSLDGMLYGPAGGYSAGPMAYSAWPQPAAAAPYAYQAAPQVSAYPAPVNYAPADQPYTLDSGDRVRLTVYGQDGLNNSYVIDPSGMITLPLGGPIMARGLTKDQLAQAITDKLRQGFLRDPHVAVEIETYRPFFILGEVNAPGQYPYAANLTVENAVAVAGGFAPRADRRRITVTRVLNGRTYRGQMPLTTPIRPGDTIQVEERWF